MFKSGIILRVIRSALLSIGLTAVLLGLNPLTVYAATSFTSSPLGSGSEGTCAVALVDVNSDGKLDIVEGNYMQQSKVYLNNGDGTFTSHNFGAGSEAVYSLTGGMSTAMANWIL